MPYTVQCAVNASAWESPAVYMQGYPVSHGLPAQSVFLSHSDQPELSAPPSGSHCSSQEEGLGQTSSKSSQCSTANPWVRQGDFLNLILPLLISSLVFFLCGWVSGLHSFYLFWWWFLLIGKCLFFNFSQEGPCCVSAQWPLTSFSPRAGIACASTPAFTESHVTQAGLELELSV